jgi:alkylation response protein AidB-like acyl-CoA dehydrogenase
MHFAFDEQQTSIKQAARRFLEDHISSEQVRRAMHSRAGFDAQLWKKIATDLGWTALMIEDRCDGLGLGFVEAVGVLEEMGRSLYASPFLASSCVAAVVISEAAGPEQRQKLLKPLASGNEITVCALPGWSVETSGVEVVGVGSDGDVLRGRIEGVAFGHAAHWILVCARSKGTGSQASLYAVPTHLPNVDVLDDPILDQTHRQATVALNDVPVDACLRMESACGPAMAKGWAAALTGLAAEALGGAERTLDMALDYAKVRHQFGRPIGSFQAIKHKLADMLVAVESARSATYYAGWAFDHAPDERLRAATMAKAYACRAYYQCAAENIQIHGGIGFTWEHDAHLFFKRAQFMLRAEGDEENQLERLAEMLEL